MALGSVILAEKMKDSEWGGVRVCAGFCLEVGGGVTGNPGPGLKDWFP